MKTIMSNVYPRLFKWDNSAIGRHTCIYQLLKFTSVKFQFKMVKLIFSEMCCNYLNMLCTTVSKNVAFLFAKNYVSVIVSNIFIAIQTSAQKKGHPRAAFLTLFFSDKLFYWNIFNVYHISIFPANFNIAVNHSVFYIHCVNSFTIYFFHCFY